MPIEVEGPDGSVIEFPDGTATSVMQRAMADKFGSPKTAAPKPGKVAVGRPAAPKSAAIRPDDAKVELDRSSALLEQKIANLPPKYQQMARDKFFADPRVASLRVASARKAPAATKPRPATADNQTPVGKFLDEYAGGNFLKALSSGASRAMFGIPERAAAAIVAPFSDKDYGEVLDDIRGQENANMAKSTTGNILGQIAGSVMGGNVAGAGVRGAGRLIASRGTGKLAQVAGRALEGAATVKQGQRVRNAAKIVAGGASAGAAQAAGEGSDVETGAAIGAAGAAIGVPVIKGLGFLSRPLRDVLGVTGKLTNLPLKRFTSASADDIERAAADYRSKTGSEPTLYELLPLADRNKLAKQVVGSSPAVQERTAAAVRQRVANVRPELRDTVREATAGRRAGIVQALDNDAAAVGSSAPGNVAASSAADLKGFQAEEARALMAPHEDTVISDDLKQLFPTSMERDPKTGEVREVFSDPEVIDAFNAAAGSLKLRPKVGTNSADIEGLTANDATRILKRLAKVDPAAPNKAAAMRAEARLMDHMDERFPQVSSAVAQMRSNYARRARMIEGMNEGTRTRTRESIPVETSDQARKIRNAYETPEGASGRFLGQSNALDRELSSGTAQDGLRVAQDIAENGQTQGALRANLGSDTAERIAGAAEAQGRSVRNLGSLSKEGSDTADSVGMEDLGRMVLALNPASMPTTKLFAISRLTTLTHLPESRAKDIVDMLFSQNPTITNRAIELLRRAGPQGTAALASIARGMAHELNDGLSEPSASGSAPVPSEGLEGSVTDTGEYEEPPVDEQPEDGVEEYGDYGEMLDAQLEQEDPELVDLWMRQTNQESGRKQFGADGQPLESSAGAVGVAQVMPGTAPEAARLAGLDWDEDAYRNDPAYNELLGLAYMKEMLRQFDGDVELALAAYNAGPGAVRKAGNRVPRIAETENYVDRILAGG